MLLDQFVRTTGYSRWYARFVLRHEGRRIQADKQTIVLAVKEQNHFPAHRVNKALQLTVR